MIPASSGPEDPGRPGRGVSGAPDDQGQSEDAGVLVPLLAGNPALTDQVRTGATLARAGGGRLHVVDPRTAMGGPAVESRTGVTREDEDALLEWALNRVPGSETGRASGVELIPGLLRGLHRTVRTTGVGTMVVPADTEAGVLTRGLADRLALGADCNVVTVNGSHGFEGAPSLLLAVANGPNSGLATDVARKVAADCGAWVDVLHVVEENVSRHRRQGARVLAEAAYHRVGRPGKTTTWVIEADDIADAIVEHSPCYELLVIGAPTKGRLRELVFGSTARTIGEEARSVVFSARSNDT